MHKGPLIILVLALGAGCGIAIAAEDMQLEGMAVKGNQELPKSLTIVPWKSSELGEIAGLPGGSLLNEELRPVERDVFRRELRYYDSVHGSE